MCKLTLLPAILASGLTFAGGQVLAQIDSGAQVSSRPVADSGEAVTSSPARPQTSPAGVDYIVGGIGNQSQQQMRDKYADYRLHVVTVREQAYVAGAQIRIEDDRDKTMLDTSMNGPLPYADLPPGTYTVKARLNGVVENRNVSIAQDQPSKIILEWPQAAR